MTDMVCRIQLCHVLNDHMLGVTCLNGHQAWVFDAGAGVVSSAALDKSWLQEKAKVV